MASTINASTSPAAIVQTADGTANLSLQSNGTTIAALTSTGMAVTGTLSASGVTTFAAGTAALPAITTTGDTNTGIWFPAADTIAFTEGGTESMRIDSSGNVLVGTTSSVRGTPKLQSVSAGDVSALFQCGNNSANNIVSWMNTTSGTRYHVAFGDGSTYIERGVISTNGSTTTYSTTSDYRLKENIAPMIGALDIVNKLKPVTYTWKENGLNGQGFIAHELAEFIPDAVVGEKDAINEDGLIKPQSIDTSFLVATLTAAIKEQQTIINDLKARVTALEGA